MCRILRKLLSYFTARETPRMDMKPVETEVNKMMNSTVKQLNEMEKLVLDDFKERLKQRVTGQWDSQDDRLFDKYTEYCAACWDGLIPQRATLLWLVEMSPLADKADVEIGKAQSGQMIHRGSPLYNVGVSFFLAGDFDRAYVYMGAAGEADFKLRGGDADAILLGEHPLARRLLRDTLYSWISRPGMWGDLYQRTCGVPLSDDEFRKLLTWMRTNDAIQTLISLHRLANLVVGPKNTASQHLGVQWLADLVQVFESSLRKWQVNAGGQLQARVYSDPDSLLKANVPAHTAFKDAENRFCDELAAKHFVKDSSDAVNWVVNDCLTVHSQAADTATCSGVACYLVYRVRNSLMHVIDTSIDLYTDTKKLMKVAGLAFSVIRLSRHGAEGTIGSL